MEHKHTLAYHVSEYKRYEAAAEKKYLDAEAARMDSIVSLTQVGYEIDTWRRAKRNAKAAFIAAIRDGWSTAQMVDATR